MTEAIAQLVCGECDPNERDAFGRTPLHCACLAGNREMAKLLLACGANVNAQNNGGQTPLHLAVCMGHRDLVTTLMNEDEVAMDVGDAHQQTPLHYAALLGDRGMLISLGGAAAETRDDEGRTPLHLAVERGDADSAEMLLTFCSANAVAVDNAGRTPLMCAEHAIPNHGRRAVMTAWELLKWIRERDVPEVSLGQDTADRLLRCAALTDNVEMAQEAITCGADIDARKGGRRRAPLHHAARFGRTRVLTQLLQWDADVHVRDIKGWTPLHAASYGGDDVAVQRLLAFGADVDARDDAQRTPLELAVAPPVIKVLLHAGASEPDLEAGRLPRFFSLYPSARRALQARMAPHAEHVACEPRFTKWQWCAVIGSAIAGYPFVKYYVRPKLPLLLHRPANDMDPGFAPE